jgi:cell division septation protein DedD
MPLVDDLREPARPVAEPSPRAAAPAPAPAAAPARKPEPAVASPARPEPPGSGFVVQVMAVNARAEADTVARRLSGKGYPAFVTTTGTGTNVTYRVRVGKYDTQREAEAVSSRLQKEEQFKPWVTK